MRERLLLKITSLLRAGMETIDALTIALQLVAWMRESELERIPLPLRYQVTAPPREMAQVAAIFQKLSLEESLGPNYSAFTPLAVASRYITPSTLLQILNTFGQVVLTEPWQATELADFVSGVIGGRTAKFQALPSELADLMVALATPSPSTRVYLPFESGFHLSYRVRAYTRQTYSTTTYRTPLPWLIDLLSDSDLRILVGDELRTPLLVQEGQLMQFDVTIAFPLLGERVSEDISTGDFYGRFVETTTSSVVLAVRHILAATRGRAVVGVPNGLLFSPGAERSLRTFLLEHQALEGVIALPPALLPGTATQTSLLVLNTSVQHTDVFFVDGTNSAFFQKDGKGRSLLVGWEQLRDLYFARQPHPFARLVSTRAVLANDATLQVSRYCLSPEVSEAEAVLAAYPVAALQTLVQFVRPVALADPAGTLPLPEVGPADFPDFGYVTEPGRTVWVTENNRAKASRQCLQHQDLILAMKGSVGKVALVEQPPELWLTGQSCMILRVTDPARIDPRTLYMFLKSGIGQSLLKQIVSAGSTVPLIQLRELEKLRVPVPSPAEQRSLIDTFEHLTGLEHQIRRIRSEQDQLVSCLWATPPR